MFPYMQIHVHNTPGKTDTKNAEELNRMMVKYTVLVLQAINKAACYGK